MKKAFIFCMLIVFPFLAFAAGTVTVTEYGGVIEMVKFDWTSNATGYATASTTNGYSGEILHVTIDPDGTSVPSAAWDMTIADGTDLDVLNGLGANLSNSTTLQIYTNSTLLPVAVGNLDLSVTNAGNATKGLVYIWIK